MITKTISELPATYRCKLCGAEKPVCEMVLVRRRASKTFLLRPRCKACHNARERGHRREWKRNYLRRWRANCPDLTEAYWRKANKLHRSRINANAYSRFRRHHDAILIQGRLRRRTGRSVSLAEARELLRKFGPAYPTKHGLTPAGVKECERIRSRLRNAGQKPNLLEIRLMVYEDGFALRPSRQPILFQVAAARLRAWHLNRKLQKARAA